ncbi:MAG TPA: response regulator transcription factor [Verrucomicrobiota bacterium]|nr:DNA-binding response regulator [Verrucomicrobiales bacterium]HRI13380.1 response regulator transcription factor [Verrucomicrobiota bacterium]
MIISVSIVDDETGLRQSIAEYLDRAPGFRCVSAYASAEEALRGLPQDRPDVVLMDIKMARMTGIECVARLKTDVPDLQVLMLTVYDDSELIFQALAAGASGYLLKRLPPEKLLEAVRDVTGGGSPMSSGIARKVVQYFQRREGRTEPRATLSPRETEVVEALAKGEAYKQIADRLHLSIPTVRTYIRRVYEKLHVHSRTEAVAKYLRR